MSTHPYTTRFWTQQYPAGIPADLPSAGAAYTSLAQFFQQTCAQHGAKTAFVSFNHELSYSELQRMAVQFCSWLQRTGIQPGDRVALMMPNLLQYPVCVFGTLLAGAVVVNTNPLYTARELHHQLHDSGARVLVVAKNFADTVATALAGTAVEQVVLTSIGEFLGPVRGRIIDAVLRYVRKAIPACPLEHTITLSQALDTHNRNVQIQFPVIRSHHLAFLQYTGGTTGLSRGAMLTHGNLLANLDQAHTWISQHLHTSTRANDQETIITALPLYHIFALTANCLTFMHLGARNVLVTNPRDIAGLVKIMRNYPFSAFTGVNTLFNALLNSPGFQKLGFSKLKVTLGGGMAVQAAVAQRWQQITGNHLTQAYGLTEASPAVAINPVGEAYNGSVGLPVPGTDIRICDENGQTVPIGRTGEIHIAGPQVTQGYWNLPQSKTESFTEHGYFKTGDVGYFNAQGYLTLVDRLRDTIIVSGFNVYPNEIEQVVIELDGIADAAAVGIPDTHSGQTVKLFVMPGSNPPDVHTIMQHCRANLAPYKVPRHIEFRSELPRSTIGKVLRRALRDPET